MLSFHDAIPGGLSSLATKCLNEAAEECMKARQFDCDVSQEYCEPFKDKFWIQQEVQVSTLPHRQAPQKS